MTDKLLVAQHIYKIIAKLQDAGFEAYVVGGAIRDLMLERSPKDYDIATNATPEEIRKVFGKRHAYIIGKRFRLVHLRYNDEVIEISTFRREPEPSSQGRKLQHYKRAPQNMIFDDNCYGSAEEDAWRRDFTVNALFFDPVNDDLIDFTGFGIQDVKNGIVRAIGEPELRFEEDPVRMLRALKLVGQYGFSLEENTERALLSSLSLIRHASISRLSLELEKILKSVYGHLIIPAFQQFGLLAYFLPFFAENWNTPMRSRALMLLQERNKRVQEGLYRDSVSLAMAALVLPFVESELGEDSGDLWIPSQEARFVIREKLLEAFFPHNMIKRLTSSAQRTLGLQPKLKMAPQPVKALISASSYSHARELLMIQNELFWQDETLASLWPKFGGSGKRPFRKKRFTKSRKRRVGAKSKQ